MPPKKKESTTSFAVSIIFILSTIVLILMFVLFMRDQGSKSVENTLSQLASTNAELQQAQKSDQAKSFKDRLMELDLDPENLWTLQPCENVPFCDFQQVVSKEDTSALSLAIERVNGYQKTFKNDEQSCDLFVMGEPGSELQLPIDMSLLATVEQKIVKDSTVNDPITLTIYRYGNEKQLMEARLTNPCEKPAYVLNVNL